MSLKFGTSGIRGLVSELTDEQVYLLTTAFLKYADSINHFGPVATGMDLRESSPRILKSVHKALTDHGRNIMNCGPVATPNLAYFAFHQNALAIMVTGSHIPADRNGIKFYLLTGETLKHQDQNIFETYKALLASKYMKELFTPAGAFKENAGISDINVFDESEQAKAIFKNRYLSFFQSSRLDGLKVLFYQHSSVARDLIPEILEKLGAQVIRLGRSETFVPVDTEAVESLELFKEWIQKHKADALVSTDGDGDRPLMIDEQGELIPGDKIGIIASRLLNIEAVALPISCNTGISQIPEFKEVIFTKIGSPFVVDSLMGLSSKFTTVGGFEANGGYILQSHIGNNNHFLKALPTRDSVLPILCALVAAKDTHKSLSKVVNKLPSRFTASILIKNCAVEKSSYILSEIINETEAFLKKLNLGISLNGLKINTLDGVRITTGDNIIIHFRPSGNAPEFRCYIEASHQNAANDLAQKINHFLTGHIANIQLNDPLI